MVVAIIGDGAFTGGMVYEGMNNIGKLDNLLVILNDNKMSISHNVGCAGRLSEPSAHHERLFYGQGKCQQLPERCACHRSAHQKRSSEQQKSDPPGHVPSTMFEDMGFTILASSTATTSRNWSAFPDRLCSARADACSMS